MYTGNDNGLWFFVQPTSRTYANGLKLSLAALVSLLAMVLEKSLPQSLVFLIPGPGVPLHCIFWCPEHTAKMSKAGVLKDQD